VPPLSARADPVQQEGQMAMPETEYEYDENDPQQPNESREDYLVRVPRKDIRSLQERAKVGDDAIARAEKAERELAFARAGIDLSSADEKVQFFVQGYQGELDAAAIKAKAEAFGVTGQTTVTITTTTDAETTATEAANVAAGLTPEGDTPLEPGEANLTRERQALTQTAPPDQLPPPEPYAEAQKVHDEVLKEGGQEKHALGAAFNSLVNAANRGDQRVIIPGPRGRSES